VTYILGTLNGIIQNLIRIRFERIDLQDRSHRLPDV
jgi:hypothetical protein